MSQFIHYYKRSNSKLFELLKQSTVFNLDNPQNYIPIYSKLFKLSETNYSNINLNHPEYLTEVIRKVDTDERISHCHIRTIYDNTQHSSPVFFKFAPLLDPFKYMMGKYANDERVINLPKLDISPNVLAKVQDPNNSAYIDGLFLFLTSQLKHQHGFIHGVTYYGSFLGIKHDFKVSIFDEDLEFIESNFFIKNVGTLFNVTGAEIKAPIKLQIGEEVQIDNIETLDDSLTEQFATDETNLYTSPKSSFMIDGDLRSDCSSRTSVTESSDIWEDISSDGITSASGSTFTSDDEIVVNICKFPVQVIAMEQCENTFDCFVNTCMIENEEHKIIPAFLQVIFILIAYQKIFRFTHNDLHSNNIMFQSTDIDFLYYRYDNKTYQVPTYGKIFKIIDFGRSIFEFNGIQFCSDSYHTDGDAATQYNCEPYYNPDKPVVLPNPSFDLCRLACSMYDHVYEEKNLSAPFVQLISEWCCDDNGLNVLYKSNGIERYPNFKLYKMIARSVHKHTPQAQLSRPVFSVFAVCDTPSLSPNIINIDHMPRLTEPFVGERVDT